MNSRVPVYISKERLIKCWKIVRLRHRWNAEVSTVILTGHSSNKYLLPMLTYYTCNSNTTIPNFSAGGFCHEKPILGTTCPVHIGRMYPTASLYYYYQSTPNLLFYNRASQERCYNVSTLSLNESWGFARHSKNSTTVHGTQFTNSHIFHQLVSEALNLYRSFHIIRIHFDLHSGEDIRIISDSKGHPLQNWKKKKNTVGIT